MKKTKREFILDYLDRNYSADVCNADFHNKWFSAFGDKRIDKNYGASPCPNAQVWLKKLYDEKIISRSIAGLHLMEPGFPKWVYVYTLKK